MCKKNSNEVYKNMSQKVTFHGDAVSLAGNSVNVGDVAPEISLVGLDLSEVKVGGKKDKMQVLLVVPSVNTPVCSDSIASVDPKILDYPKAEAVGISMDLPFAMKAYGESKGLKNVRAASDFRNHEFAKAYGVLIADGPLKGLTARAVFVVDTDGKICYKEICSEIGEHPDYEALKKALS